MKSKIINLLAELLADQTERTVQINEIQEDRLVANECSNHSYELCNNHKPTMGKTVGGANC